MKKSFLIILVLLFGTLGFAKTDKETYKTVVTTFCDKGSCIIIEIPNRPQSFLKQQSPQYVYMTNICSRWVLEYR